MHAADNEARPLTYSRRRCDIGHMYL